jgi:hypothetical protein
LPEYLPVRRLAVEELDHRQRRRLLAARAGVITLVQTALFSVVLVALAPGAVVAQPIEKKGTTPYVAHFIFRPLMSIDIPGLGTATNLEAVGTTQKMNGEKMLDKMSARSAALSVGSGDKKYTRSIRCGTQDRG